APKTAIQELATMKEEDYAVLRKAVAEVRLYTEPTALIEETSSSVLSHTKLGGQIVTAMIGIRSVMDRLNMSGPEVAAGVARDAEEKKYVPKESSIALLQR